MQVTKCQPKDQKRGIFRIAKGTARELELKQGANIKVFKENSKKYIAGVVLFSEESEEALHIIKMDESQMRRIGTKPGDLVKIQEINIKPALQISLAGYSASITLHNAQSIMTRIMNRIITIGDILSFFIKNKRIDLIVINHTPQATAVKVTQNTAIFCQK